jgi:hypothetical protein
MEAIKRGNGWYYKDDSPPKSNYKIQITPLDKSQEQYVMKIETHDIEWSMEQYQRNRGQFEWEMMDWNIQV